VKPGRIGTYPGKICGHSVLIFAPHAGSGKSREHRADQGTGAFSRALEELDGEADQGTGSQPVSPVDAAWPLRNHHVE
jgi:hypothetical protein